MVEKRQVTGRKAAVLILVRDPGSVDPHILLTKRAAHMSTHAGEIAFPGGMQDVGDLSVEATALRETEEEVGVEAKNIAIQLRLPRSYTRQGVEVIPVVGHLINEVPLRLSDFEIESAFWVPYSFLAADQRLRTDIFSRDNEEFWAPAYRFQGHVIWGFTARLLVEFMNRCGGQAIGRQHGAPEAVFK